MKKIMYCIIGILGTIALVLLALPVFVYGYFTRAVFHPIETANEIIDVCGKFQVWIDKQLENKK